MTKPNKRQGLVVGLMVSLVAPVAHAQSVDDAIFDELRGDLTTLGVNLPVWMSRQMPSMMAPVGLGAGSAISSDAGGFSLGVLTRVGLMNNLDDVGYGLQLVDIQSELPSLMPWPQFGVVLGVNLGHGFELGGDIQFIPAMDIAADNLSLKAEMFSGAFSLRWRANQADGLLPAFVMGLGVSYTQGDFSVGAGYSEPYSDTVDGQEVQGTVSVNAAPGVHWSLFQLSPELRLAWDVGGIFRPYLGVNLGLTFGDVGNRLSLRGQATIESIDGRPVERDPVIYEGYDHLYESAASKWALRPHVGFDLVIGVLAFTAQIDLAVAGRERINTDLDEAAASFDLKDPNFLFNEQARSSGTDATLIGTFVARLQF